MSRVNQEVHAIAMVYTQDGQPEDAFIMKKFNHCGQLSNYNPFDHSAAFGRDTSFSLRNNIKGTSVSV